MDGQLFDRRRGPLQIAPLASGERRMLLSVVVPCMNEEEVLRQTHTHLVSVCKSHPPISKLFTSMTVARTRPAMCFGNCRLATQESGLSAFPGISATRWRSPRDSSTRRAMLS